MNLVIPATEPAQSHKKNKKGIKEIIMTSTSILLCVKIGLNTIKLIISKFDILSQ